MMTSLRSKWAASKARGGRISKLIRNRGATQPPAHFHRNPLGRGQLAVFPSRGRGTRSSRIDLDMLVARALKNSRLGGRESDAHFGETTLGRVGLRLRQGFGGRVRAVRLCP